MYALLKATARARGLVTYSDLGRVADFDVAVPAQMDKVVKALDEIALHEMAAGRPLLPVVVIRADKQMPSGGIFTFARRHGLMKDKDQVGYFSAELSRVYAFWAADPRSQQG